MRKKHASGNFSLRSVEFSLFPTPDPFPLPFIAPQSGPSFFSLFSAYGNQLRFKYKDSKEQRYSSSLKLQVIVCALIANGMLILLKGVTFTLVIRVHSGTLW